MRRRLVAAGCALTVLTALVVLAWPSTAQVPHTARSASSSTTTTITLAPPAETATSVVPESTTTTRAPLPPASLPSSSTPAPPLTAPPAPAPALGGFIGAMNADRAANELAPLALDGALTAQAAISAQRIAGLGQLVHTDMLTVSVAAGLARPYSYVGENLAYAPGSWTVGQFETLWRNSPTHWANIIRPDYTHAGCAEAFDAIGQRWVACWFGVSR